MLLETVHLNYFPLPGPNHLQLNFNTEMQDFKLVLSLNCNLKRGLNNLIFPIGFEMLEI